MTREAILLIGMPGSGKSTVGPLVAEALGWAFVDLDRAIEAGEGARLVDLVARLGPEGFIELEGRYLAGLDLDRVVVASGGSAVYHAGVMRDLSRRAFVVCLTATLAELEAAAGDLGRRAVVSRGAKTLPEILAEREPLMARQSHVSVRRSGKSPRETADEVLGYYRLAAREVAEGVVEYFYGVNHRLGVLFECDGHDSALGDVLDDLRAGGYRVVSVGPPEPQYRDEAERDTMPLHLMYRRRVAVRYDPAYASGYRTRHHPEGRPGKG